MEWVDAMASWNDKTDEVAGSAGVAAAVEILAQGMRDNNGDSANPRKESLMGLTFPASSATSTFSNLSSGEVIAIK